MEDARSQLAQHLASIGYELGAPRDAILNKLRQRMGEERYLQFEKVWKAARTPTNQAELYGSFQDLIEGNLLRSLDPGATLEVANQLYRAGTSDFKPNARVIELGCWTGGLASFIASRHPQCAVVGVDAARKVVDACNAHYQTSNLKFVRWNYQWGKPEELEPADVLLCGMGVNHTRTDNTKLADPASVRLSPEYRRQRDQAVGYFGLWRTAAKHGARLYVVLRLVQFTRFLAWLDAAQAAGWTPQLDRLWNVDLPAEKQILPGLVFQAAKSEPLDEADVLDRWALFEQKRHVFACLKGAVALAAFRVLGTKKTMATREYRRPDTLLTRDEVGTVSGTGYVFTDDALSAYRLLFVSRQRARELAASVTPISNIPITDGGSFGVAGATGVANTPSGSSPFFARKASLSG